MSATARVELDTSAQGLLARLGHDLRLSVERFEIELAEGLVQARFALASLRVVGTLHGERCDTSAPSAGDRAQIERTVRDEILHVARNPEASWYARATLQPSMAPGGVMRGELSLCGRQAPVQLAITRSAQVLQARAVLTPSTFGIAPYKALGGALKVADRVVVQASLPFDDRPDSELLQASVTWRVG